ncbi:guanine nucleotide binding protein, alpha subunit [Mycena amicta]|nr:guanine nucleotide binding protein, alpha subunit [Mycena amicta]
MVRSYEDDPLALAIAPPPNETPSARETRERAEREASRISDEIDALLRRERETEKKKKPVKLLLLGQSESGKSSVLKNFQILYCRRQWAEERSSWRCVILLNLVRNVNEILDVLGREMLTKNDAIVEVPRNSVAGPRNGTHHAQLKFKDTHRLLRLRLAPLRRVRLDLEARLGAAANELYTTDTTSAAPFDPDAEGSARKAREKPHVTEFSVHSRNGWKSALDRFRAARRSGEDNGGTMRRGVRDLEDEVQSVLAGCREDIRALWEDRVVREMMARRKVRIEDSAGFFLNDVDRIAREDYQITDEDIIRARLRTLGVQEYRVTFDHATSTIATPLSSLRELYYPCHSNDTNESCSPVSCFDEKLAEDRRVNRLEDSYMLWKSVCSCKLLARTQLVLFLNKCDLLQAKLMRGVKIRDSVPSFGDRRNDVATATKYFQQHFKEIQRTYSPVQRPFYVHLTSVIDTKSTAVTLGAVEESILRDHLRRADLM